MLPIDAVDLIGLNLQYHQANCEVLPGMREGQAPMIKVSYNEQA